MTKKFLVLFVSASMMCLTSCGMNTQTTNATDQSDNDVLTFVPNVKSDFPLNLSNLKDKVKAAERFPVWVETDVLQEYEGVLSYNLDLGYGMMTQQLFKELPGAPLDKMEVGRVIIIDLNKDGHSDALVCLGRYGSDKTLYFDAYVWDPEEFGGRYVEVEDFRQISNPGIDKKTSDIIGRNGADREVWCFKGISEIEKK